MTPTCQYGTMKQHSFLMALESRPASCSLYDACKLLGIVPVEHPGHWWTVSPGDASKLIEFYL